MPLVLQTNELNRAPERPEPLNHLFGFANRHSRIVGAVDHQ